MCGIHDSNLANVKLIESMCFDVQLQDQLVSEVTAVTNLCSIDMAVYNTAM